MRKLQWMAALLVSLAATARGGTQLRYQVEQTGDFQLIGNTLGWDCNNSTSLVVKGTIINNPGLLGLGSDLCQDVNDTAPDVYWVGGYLPDGGGAIADRNNIPPASARTAAVLALNSGSTVTYARLYWGALSSGTTADAQVTLDRPGTSFTSSVTADASTTVPWTQDANAVFYQSSADVTNLVRAQGNGVYRVSGIDSRDFRGTDADSSVRYGGWSLVVYYSNGSETKRNLALFDGLSEVDATHPLSTTVTGFRVPTVGFDAKLGVVAYEGDQSLTGDSLYFDGITTLPDGGTVASDGGPLSDANNPANNFFNSTRSTLGVLTHRSGDLPELTGGPGSMTGLDLDVVDVTGHVLAGQQSAQIQAKSTGDLFVVGVIATSIATYTPDYSTSMKTIANLTRADGTFRAGDLVEYTINATNTGNDTSLNTVLTDPVPSAVNYVAGSMTLNGVTLTDATGDDVGDYAAGTNTLTVRLGTGATAVAGGTLVSGGSAIIKFRGTIAASASGTLANQAMISSAGVRGAPTAQTPTSSPTGPGTPTVVTVSSTPTPVILQPTENGVTTNRQPSISGTGEVGDAVTVTEGSAVLCTAVVQGDGTWSCAPTQPLADAVHTVLVTQSNNSSGLQSAPATVHFTTDVTAPETTITSGPPQFTSSTSATFGVTATDNVSGVAHLRCNLDNAGYVDCPLTGTYVVQYDNLSPQQHTLLIKAVDAAGNEDLSPAQDTWTVDTSAPASPTLAAPADGSTVQNLPSTLTGTAEAGSVVMVSVDGNLVCTATANGSGQWSCPANATLADGAHTLVATATDAAGNTSLPTTVHFTTDSAAPGTPTLTSPQPGASVSTATPTLTGTADANSTVVVTVDGTPHSVTASGSGTWSYTSGTLADGTHTVTLASHDAAGNQSPTAGPFSFSTDTQAPVAPAITTPADNGHVSVVRPDLAGTAEAGSQVAVSIDSASVGTVTADATGHWRYTPTADLAEGAHTAQVTSTDAAGNHTSSATSHFTVDAGASATPQVLTPAEGALTGDSTPTISGTAGPGYSVAVIIDGATVATVTADGSGAWSYTPTAVLSDGSHTVGVMATDAGGNATPSATVHFTVDTQAPASPVITAPDGGALDTAAPTLAGTAEPGSTVQVRVDGQPVGTAPVDASGHWTYTPTTPLTDGTHDLTAVDIDAAGNASAPSAAVTVQVDTTAPGRPVILSPTAGAVTSAQPQIGGTAEAGSKVAVTLDGVAQPPVTADASGRWSFTPSAPLSDGAHTATATATDAAGNVSPVSLPVSFESSTLAPNQPVITSPTSGTHSNHTTWSVEGTAPANSQVAVVVNGVVVATVPADATGHFSVQVGPLAEGTYALTATATTATGTSAPAVPVTLVIDTTAPGAPTITSGADGGTVDPHGPITGTAEPGSTVTVTVDGTPHTVTTDSSGNWSYTPSPDLSTGTHSVSAIATDAAGNSSTATTATLTIASGTSGSTGSTATSASNSTGSTGTTATTSNASNSSSGSTGSTATSANASTGSTGTTATTSNASNGSTGTTATTSNASNSTSGSTGTTATTSNASNSTSGSTGTAATASNGTGSTGTHSSSTGSSGSTGSTATSLGSSTGSGTTGSDGEVTGLGGGGGCASTGGLDGLALLGLAGLLRRRRA